MLGGLFSVTLSVTPGFPPWSPRFHEACRPSVFGLSSGSEFDPASDHLPPAQSYHSEVPGSKGGVRGAGVRVRSFGFRGRGSDNEARGQVPPILAKPELRTLNQELKIRHYSHETLKTRGKVTFPFSMLLGKMVCGKILLRGVGKLI